MEHGAVRGWFGVSRVHHGYQSNAEVDPESVDHSEAEEHEHGQVEADRAALGRHCSSKIQRYLHAVWFVHGLRKFSYFLTY